MDYGSFTIIIYVTQIPILCSPCAEGFLHCLKRIVPSHYPVVLIELWLVYLFLFSLHRELLTQQTNDE